MQRLRAAGLVVLAKANLSEWANFRSVRSSSGWSATGGQCLNPHALDRSPGGSSSGSGAGVAAGLAPLAVGTETDGSILCPAALNGVVGIKPTVGLTSRAGVVPISSSQDTVGPMARCVADAAALLGVLAGGAAGADPLDEATMKRPAGLPADYMACCRSDGLDGARIGLPRETLLRLQPEGRRPRRGHLAARPAGRCRSRRSGERPDCGSDLAEQRRADGDASRVQGGPRALLRHEAARERPAANLDELVAFNDAHAPDELLYFGQDTLLLASSVGGVDDPAYLEAWARNWRRARQDGIDAALTSVRLDVLAFPTMGPAWLTDHVNGDSHTRAGYQAAAVAGYPAISIPIGKAGGLPVGLCLVGTAWSEPVLIRIAFGIEQMLALGDSLRPAWLARAG